MSKSDTHDGEEQTGLIRTTGPMMTRRNVLRAGAAGAGAVAVGAGGPTVADELGATTTAGTAEAIAPVALPAGVAAGAAVGWVLRETQVIGSDAPGAGLTPEALEQQIYDIVTARESSNASTFIDNGSILAGMENTAYADAKIAAIEELNEESSESEVLDAAESALDDYETTLKGNLLRSWNESVEELETIISAIGNHSDLSSSDVFDGEVNPGVNLNDETYEFPDGTDIELHRPESGHEATNPSNVRWTPIDYETDMNGEVSDASVITNEGTEYLDYAEWSQIFDDIELQMDNVRGNIDTWVSTVYDDVVAGDLDTEDLLTPRELAELTSDDEDFNQAIADLSALNYAVDLEREAEVFLQDTGVTLYGSLAWTAEGTMDTGEIDPSEDEGFYYLTYDVSQGHGSWDNYLEDTSDGVFVFNESPLESSLYQVETADNETVTFSGDDMNEFEGEWSIDQSGNLENESAGIESVEFFAESDETEIVTVQLEEPFEIIEFTDSDGETHDSSEFERPEPQDDTNYITTEEWEDQQERHEELIDEFEEGSGGGGLFPGFGDIGTGGVIGGAVAIVGGIFVVSNVLGD